MKTLVYLSLVCIGLVLVMCPTEAAVLVKDHQPRAIIQIRQNATELELIAAEDLAKYIAESTGGFISTTREVQKPSSRMAVLSIGVAGSASFEKIDQKSIPYQGFRIICKDNRIDFIGSTRQGASNAVYWFLRNKLGVEWYMPTKLGEEVPKMDSFVLAEFDVVKEPSFICIRRATGRRAELERYGIRHHDTIKYYDNSGYNIDYGFSHNWEYVVPLTTENKYKHPEWFPLLSEKEQNAAHAWDSPSGRRGYQVCTTNEEVIQQFVKKAREQFQQHPKRRFFSISPNDWQENCHCENCLALDKKLGVTSPPYADRFIYFGNRIAELLADEFPDKRLGFQAYSTHTAPPRVVKPHPMIVPILCPHGGRFCYRHPINDPRSKKNKQWKEKYFDGWTKLCKEIAFYGYWGSYDSWHGPMPTIADRELPFLRENNVKIITDCTNRNWATNAPWYYLWSRMAWDTTLDPEQIYDEFCGAMYGPAKQTMLEYWQAWSIAWDAAPTRDNRGYHLEQTFSEELIQEQWNRIRTAEKTVANSPDRYKKRVELARVGLLYTDHMVAAIRAEAGGDYETAVAQMKEAIAAMILGKAIPGPPAFSSSGVEYGLEDRTQARILKNYIEKAKSEKK
jgi:uncharacterized protein DUF4838